MKIDIKNSSGKIVGEVDTFQDRTVIKTNTKPELIISDLSLLNAIKDKDTSDAILLELYDEYFLTIGEIAALYNRTYSVANGWIKKIPHISRQKENRRNPSYGKVFSKERIENISNGLKTYYQSNPHPNQGKPLSQEQKRQISETLKQKYSTGILVNDPQKFREAWKRGCYDKVDFKRGIGGYLFSIKTNKKIFFRSLLELKFLLKIEEDPTVYTYKYEAIRISCEDGTLYTPDIFINDDTIIELKPKKYIYNQPDIQLRFEYKCQQAQKYCQERQLNFKVIWDTDIQFDSRQMKKELQNNPDLIKKYSIEFLDKKRVGLK